MISILYSDFAKMLVLISLLQTETICYCSYYLCNQEETTSPPNISPGGPSITLTLLLPSLLSCLLSSS